MDANRSAKERYIISLAARVRFNSFLKIKYDTIIKIEPTHDAIELNPTANQVIKYILCKLPYRIISECVPLCGMKRSSHVPVFNIRMSIVEL
jgi:hypothetical protein